MVDTLLGDAARAVKTVSREQAWMSEAEIQTEVDHSHDQKRRNQLAGLGGAALYPVIAATPVFVGSWPLSQNGLTRNMRSQCRQACHKLSFATVPWNIRFGATCKT